MRPALPASDYYGGSAPSRPDRPTMDPAPQLRWPRGARRGPERFPCSLTTRSMKEEPDSVPAASPQLTRSTSPWPPGRRSYSDPGVPHPRRNQQRRWVRTAPGPDPPGSSRYGLERRKRRFLSYSSPSRSPDPHHLAVLTCPGFDGAAPTRPGISQDRLPPTSPSCCDRTAAKVSHLHSSNQRLTAHPDVPEGEGTQERAQRRRRPHPREHLPHAAVAQHVEVIDGVRSGEHPCHHAGRLGRRVRRRHAQPLLEQVLQTCSVGQSHHRDQTCRTDQVRVIENGRYLVRCLHLSDAPSELVGSNSRKSNPPVPQGHSRVTTRRIPRLFGGSGLRSRGPTGDGPGSKCV